MQDHLYIYLAIGAGVVFFFIGWYLRVQGRKELLAEKQLQEAAVAAAPPPPPSFVSHNPEMRRLQLQAYERCIILCERLAFTSLLERSGYQTMTANQLKTVLIQNIKNEFDYNISQQLYVSPAAWDALTNLKEQQIFIINQIGTLLPENAGGQAMAEKIMELLTHDENVSLQPIVATLLRKEARLLMQ
jgi:hypothetical protein